MDILVFNQQTDLLIDPESVKHVVKHVLHQENQKTDEVAIYFVTSEKISQLHQEFFNDASVTDCISFPIDGPETSGYHVLGEIFLCPKKAIDYVSNLSDCYQELTLYLVHGLLHLIGYDDIEEKDREKMRACEQKHMIPLIRQKLILNG